MEFHIILYTKFDQIRVFIPKNFIKIFYLFFIEVNQKEFGEKVNKFEELGVRLLTLS